MQVGKMPAIGQGAVDPVSSSPTTMDRMTREQPLTKHEKMMIVSSLLKQAPPEEFCEAFSDLRLLVAGTIMVQAHYFEDGNIHLTVCKDVAETLPVTTETQTTQDFVKLLEDADNEFQGELMEEYQRMSNTHLKAFRRQLPITHSMIDWEKIVTAKIVEAAAVQ
nr:F-actin-capping protein subunit alpha-1-like isoform X3 [Pelodiscus sinensis]|eukprot:XP_025040585.1 F-actin-capping protein subunit alpha-1-like isoform X3 [Pelodiscus sinensis]